MSAGTDTWAAVEGESFQFRVRRNHFANYLFEMISYFHWVKQDVMRLLQVQSKLARGEQYHNHRHDSVHSVMRIHTCRRLVKLWLLIVVKSDYWWLGPSPDLIKYCNFLFESLNQYFDLQQSIELVETFQISFTV